MAYTLKGKRILVTGATGLIGSHLTLALLNEGCRVRAMVRDTGKAKFLADKGAEVVYGEMTDPGSLENAVQDCQVVFHLAGVLGSQSKPLSYFRKVNVQGTKLLAEAALKVKVERFIYASTAWVYGFQAGEVNEQSPRRFSKDHYCDTKLEAENLILRMIKNQGLPGVIVQPSEVYGPGDHTWTLDPIQLIKSGMMLLPLEGQGVIQPIFIDDLIEGVIAAATNGVVGEAYILCGAITSVRKFFGYYAPMVGKKGIPSVPGFLLLFLAGAAEVFAGIFRQPPAFTRCGARGVMKTTTYSNQKAGYELQFLPKTIVEQGMRKVEEWLKTAEEKGEG